MIDDRDNQEKALTSIRAAYTLSATRNAGEVEQIMIRNFLETLAEVALAIAARNMIKLENNR